MKKILGLDLGSASIGWALIDQINSDNEQKTSIIGMGSRIIPYEGTEGKDFEKGTGESRNSKRTASRSIRRGYDRYQQRRKILIDELSKHGMLPGNDLRDLPKLKLWELRSSAVMNQIEPKELGRILLHLNQRRGYKSNRTEANKDKKETEYVTNVQNRYQIIRERNQTVGQFIYNNLSRDEFFRAKEQVFPREAYIDEYNKIMSVQKKYYSGLTEDLITKIRDEVIYYQRPLKSQKGLVSVCEFEGVKSIKDGKGFFTGPKVANRSNPLFQISRIWETINAIELSTPQGEKVKLELSQKLKIFEYLDNHEELSSSQFHKLIGAKKDDYVLPAQFKRNIKGNSTKTKILKCLEGHSPNAELFKLNLKIVETGNDQYIYSKDTGEITGSKLSKYVHSDVEKEPFYRLWHTIYSINDEVECKKALIKKFGIDEISASKLSSIDFTIGGFGNKSVKVIRKILPYLMEGDRYSDAMAYAGYNHSGSLTKKENLNRELNTKLDLLTKNSLRQPVVEKILNQMINVVNAIIDKYGRPDEIRIELARELKQSREERNNTDLVQRRREREGIEIIKTLEEHGIRPTKNNILKYRLYKEINNDESKINAICIYCGQPISFTDALLGNDVDIEHIIPRSKLFDDSQSNKTLSHRHCNLSKGDMTAYDFMSGRGEVALNDYVTRINLLFSKGVINFSKRRNLLMPESKIPSDFIDRQIRETQYISRKAREILQTICPTVWTTTGQVTSELRHLWGWDDVTMNLQIDKYRSLGMTEYNEWKTDNGRNSKRKEVIKGWTKRDDHRHHAIDALTIACTNQAFIQRFNTLNASKTRTELQNLVEESGTGYKGKMSLLEKYIVSCRPLSVKEVEDATARILVSFKSGKKVAVKGLRLVGKKGKKQVAQRGIIVPRGPLSEESVYGKIYTTERKSVKQLFDKPEIIVKSRIRNIITSRIEYFNGDKQKAVQSIKKEPLYLDPEKKIPLEFGLCYREEYVIRYKVDTNFNKADKIIDGHIKKIIQNRLTKFGNKPKEAFKDVKGEGDKIIKWFEDEGLKRPITSVRCYTGLSAVVPVRKNDHGVDIGFVKPGNNHHIAIYEDIAGGLHEHVCTFWHAVERKKYGLPIVISDSDLIWDIILKEHEDKFPESFLKMLPEQGLKLKLSMQQNEMFCMGMEKPDIEQCVASKNYAQLSTSLYRVQKLASSYYVFRHHLETQLDDSDEAFQSKRYSRIRSISSLIDQCPVKVIISPIGEIISVL